MTWIKFIDQLPDKNKLIIARTIMAKIEGEPHYFDENSDNVPRADLPYFEWTYVEQTDQQNTMPVGIIEKARLYAANCHRNVNHLYDGKPYEFHLEMVANFAAKYQYLLPEENRADFIAAAWTHDVIEDTRQTYNDVKTATNEAVAELTYALTNEKGKNRKQRASKKYYEDMRPIEGALLLKICDRLANVSHSKSTSSRMYKVYQNENLDFILNVFDERYKDAITELCTLFDQASTGL